MLPDELCPECHGKPDTFYKSADHLSKQCVDCGHRWSEEVIETVPTTRQTGRPTVRIDPIELTEDQKLWARLRRFVAELEHEFHAGENEKLDAFLTAMGH